MLDFTRKYGTLDRQLELLKMIKDINMFFENNDIKYSLCGGTLLGAVREKGFIPWDDDVDIMVDRDNFNKIIELFSKSKNLEYVINDYLWVRRIQKRNEVRESLTVPTIDIFIVDNCPDNFILRRVKLITIMTLQGMMKKNTVYSDFSLYYRLALYFTHFLGGFFSNEKKLDWYDRVSKFGNNKKTKYLSIYNDLFKYLKLKYSNEMFIKFEKVPFEDLLLPITTKYDNYLTTVYNDYMTPPKEKDRVPVHLN